MYNTLINAREELRALKRLLKKTGAAKISSGTLERSVSSKGVRFVFRNRKTGKRVVLSAGEAEEICIAKYQAALHKRLLKNCRALESFLRNYSSVRPEDIWASLPESYRPLPNSTPCTASKDTGNSIIQVCHPRTSH